MWGREIPLKSLLYSGRRYRAELLLPKDDDNRTKIVQMCFHGWDGPGGSGGETFFSSEVPRPLRVKTPTRSLIFFGRPTRAPYLAVEMTRALTSSKREDLPTIACR